MRRRVLLKFISPRDESGSNVEYDNEDFRKSNEGVPQMFVTLLGSVLHCCNREYFSNDQQKRDYREDIISISDPYRIFASEVVLTLSWKRVILVRPFRKGLEYSYI